VGGKTHNLEKKQNVGKVEVRKGKRKIVLLTLFVIENENLRRVPLENTGTTRKYENVSVSSTKKGAKTEKVPWHLGG